MGGSSSKSPFDRRNSVERRTQRRALTSIKVRLQKIEKDLKKFNGSQHDEEYQHLSSSLTALKKELVKKSANLQQKNKDSYNEIAERLTEAFQLLKDKSSVSPTTKHYVRPFSDPGVSIERQDSDATNNSEIRHTVDLTVVQLTPQPERPDSQASNVRSPEDKRKSILKMGVPVMPGAMVEADVQKKSVRHVEPPKPESDSQVIEGIKKQIEELELEIANFIGKKNGTHYNRLKEKLYKNLEKLTDISVKDDVLVEQKDLCVQYVKSCLNFLDEKADSNDGRDDVFLPSNGGDVSTLTKKLAATSV